MATAGDGVTSYQSGGVGGKFRKRPIRRSAQATPYDRPPTALRNNSPSLFSKLMDPASRLIYAGADRLFGVFRKRLPSIPAQRQPETGEEQRNGIQEAVPNNCNGVSKPSTDEGGNSAIISTATEISDLENMLKQKTFTRSEIERLTALLQSRTTVSDVGEGERAKLPDTTSHLLRLKASTSGPMNKHLEERENFHAAISTPVVKSMAFEEDVASPAELAKAYMGTRPAKVSPSTLRFGSQAPRQDSVLLSNTTILPRTPITSLAPRTTPGSFKGFENGLTTPRSRGRSAIYNMARTPYYRGPSTFSQKGIKSDYDHGVASPALEGSIGSSKMAVKRRSSALDDIGSGGPVRRIRQKANLPSQASPLSKHRSQFGQPGTSSQRLLLRNEPEPKTSKAIEENGETSKHSFGYASVPTKSTQTASKILEQLERMSPKEKSSGSRLAGTAEKSTTKLTSNMDKVESPKFLSNSQDNQKSESQRKTWLPDARESTSQSKDKGEENGPRKFAVPRNMFSSINGNSTGPARDNAPIVTHSDSTLKLPVEPPQKKRVFQMSAHEESLEVNEDNHSNGHVSIPLGEHKKPGTSVFSNKDVSADGPANVIQTYALPEVDKIQGMPEFKKVDAVSPPKTDFGSPGGTVDSKKMGFNFTNSPPSSGKTQSAVLFQSTSVDPQKEATAFLTFGTSTKSTEKAPVFSFSANVPSGVKPNVSLDSKPVGSTSLFSSALKNDQVQFSASNKDDNVNAQKPVTMSSKPESLSSASPTTASASGMFSFGGSTKNSSITNGTSSVFTSSSPFTASGTDANKVFSSSSSHVLSSATTGLLPSTTTTTSASSSVFSTSVPASAPAPIFSFGSAVASSTSALLAPETSATKDKEPKSDNISSSPPFASTSFANGFQANAQASIGFSQVDPFKFGSSSTSRESETTATPSYTLGSSDFGSSAPAFSSAPSFGLSSGSSTSTSTTNIFGSGFSSTPSFGLSSAVATSETKFGSSASGSTSSSSSSSSSMFGSGSAWQPLQSSAFGSQSTPFSFGASSTSMPSATSLPTVFGSSNAAGGASKGSSMFSFTSNSSFPAPSPGQSVFGNSTPVFGAGVASPNNNNNDQMSMEDSMAEDSMQTPSSTFGQASAGGTPGGFMFGSATPTPAPSPVPFQFSGQTSQAPSPNPFEASGSMEFNAGGSFSLGSGGGDKSGRRILKVKRQARRK